MSVARSNAIFPDTGGEGYVSKSSGLRYSTSQYAVTGSLVPQIPPGTKRFAPHPCGELRSPAARSVGKATAIT